MVVFDIPKSLLNNVCFKSVERPPCFKSGMENCVECNIVIVYAVYLN